MSSDESPGPNQDRSQVLLAGAKVNLYLRILGRREDGLHELESVFLPLTRPRDRLLLESAVPGAGLVLTCSQRELETPSNILYATYRVFGDRTGMYPDLKLHLDKEIPSGAGLGGGSSDAAAFLMHLNSLLSQSRRLSLAELRHLAGRIGSDVPFFLTNQAALVTGAGESIEPIALDLGAVSLVLVCPEYRVPTAEAYAAWDRQNRRQGSARLQQKDLTDRTGRFTKGFRFSGFLCWNDFEQVVFCTYPALRSLKEALLKQGAAAVTLTGSGSALVAFFHSQTLVAHACSWLKENRISCYVTEQWGVAKR